MKIKEKIYEIFQSNSESIYTADQIQLILSGFFSGITKNYFNLSDYVSIKYSPEVFLQRVSRGHYQFLPNSNIKKVKMNKINKVTVGSNDYITKIQKNTTSVTIEEIDNTKSGEEFLEKFLLFSKDSLITIDQFLQTYQDNGIHDFNIEILINYHKILDKYQSERLYLFKDFFILNDRGIRVYFLNENIKTTQFYSILLRGLREKKVKRILSAVKLNLTSDEQKKIREGIEDEVCSNLIETFDKNNYESGKKYNKKVTQALNLKSRVELRDITESDFELIESLNEQWALYKLNVVQVHGISFPRGRYKNAAKNLVKYKDYISGKVFNKLILVDGVPYGFTTYTIHGTNAYEHGYVSLYFDDSFHIDNSLLKNFFFSELLKEGVVTVNSGFALNKKLREFKTIHTKGSTYVNKYVYLTK